MPRQPQQPAFSDVQINDDEELEQQLRIVLQNQPTDEDIARGKTRRAATKKAKEILLNRHRTDCQEAGDEKQWIRVAEVACIKPSVVHHEEQTKSVTFFEGGRDEVTVKIMPASWQPALDGSTPEPVAV